MVHIFGFYAVFLQIIRQIFCHLNGKRCDKRTFTAVNPLSNLAEQIFNLTFNRAHLNHGVKQSGRTDNLLRNAAGVFSLIRAGCRADINRLPHLGFKLLIFQRPVVKSRRQAEAVFDKRLFAAVIAAEHSPYLGQHNMTLIHHQDKIIREIVKQCCRC